MIEKKQKRKILVGDVEIGANSKVTIQSMTNTDTSDIKKTVAQIKALEEAGCEIVRVAVTDKSAAIAIKEIKKQISIPIAADIQYDHNLAIMAIENGADKLRINPGNIGNKENVAAVIKKLKERNASF